MVETVRFSATGDDLIHDGIFLQARQRGGDHYDFDFAYEEMRDFYTQFDVNWLNQETLVNDQFDASGYPMFSTPRLHHRHAVQSRIPGVQPVQQSQL